MAKKKAATNKKKVKRKLPFPKTFFLLGVLISLFLFNIGWQLYRKPTELLRPAIGFFHKSPIETWRDYQDEFQKYSGKYFRPSFLAALAQIESNGNPLAQSYWDWRFSTNWRRIFAPASSAVGIYQITNSTFLDAKRFCKKSGKLFYDATHLKLKHCKENRYASRLSAEDSIRMVSSRMEYYLNKLLRGRKLSLQQSERVASVLHLCGVYKAKRFVKAGLSYRAIGKCGSHNPRYYYKKIQKQQRKIAGYKVARR